RKRRVSRDGHLVLYQRRGNAQGRARRRTRTVDFAPVAPRVGDVLEYRLAAVADGDAQRTGDLQFALALVTLVAVAAVGGAHERLRLALEAGEQVLAARIAGIHQRQQLVLALTQLGGDGLAILRRERAVAGAQGQLAHAQQHGIYRVERHFLLGQAAVRRRQVGVVLVEHVLLLFELQQAHRCDRVVGRREDTVAGADLLLGARNVGVVALQSGDAVVEGLQGRDAHGRACYLKELINVSNKERAT